MTKRNSTAHYLVFDIVRGISALFVCTNHLRSAIFIDFAELMQPTIFDKLFYLATSLGHESVIMFFIISGYLIGGTILKNRDSFQPKEYTINRLSRLYTVFIPALITTAIIDFFLSLNNPEALGSYYKQWSSGPTVENYSNSLLTFFGNIFFLQNIFVSSFGTNSPLWSLSYEFWYYVTFPLLLIPLSALTNKNKPSTYFGTNIALLTLSGVIIFLMPFDMKVSFLIWIMGAVFVLFRKRKLSFGVKIFSLVAFIFSLLSIKVSPFKDIEPHLKDLYLTAAFSLFLITNLNSTYTPIQKTKLIQKIINFLSNISFTLYLFHFPLIVLLTTTFVGKTPLTPDLQGYLTYTMFLITILLVCYGLWWSFERNTTHVKRIISGK